MKINLSKVLIGGLLFFSIQRILSVISIVCIKPYIPREMKEDNKEAIQTAFEAFILIATVVILQKNN